ncbi:hypothetical protein [Azohydromonas lata]|uniref:Uncharacterized protein n=1 Tax=Azohydromonas lata TaxID=45677 RepID=A0ABU5IKA0_9BURK|nr:hypothetical protein [Azohydromonas lata]MDZ5459310.1 hypothetical protein [Azohydromonas lata]
MTHDDPVLSLLGGDDDPTDLVHATPADVARDKIADMLIPGLLVTFTAAEAKAAGAFEETALSEADALASALDLGA